MADQGHDLEEAAPAGWYPDPWSSAHHRYWTGATWSASSFPNGPSSVQSVPATEEVPGGVGRSIPDATPPDASPRSASSWRRLLSGRALVAVGLVGGLGVGFLIAFTITSLRNGGTANTPTAVPATPSVAAPADPAATALSGLVVRQADVPSGSSVQLIPAGNQLDQPTLDLCNGAFPSESMRTARLQVAVADSQGSDVLSTEAVLYKNSAASAQGFAELRAAASDCPTKLNPTPDTSWPSVTTVERLTFDFTSTDRSGRAQRNVAVYLRRGRALIGLYFYAPDGPQLAVAGQTTIPTIVNSFATRMAQLPSSLVG